MAVATPFLPSRRPALSGEGASKNGNGIRAVPIPEDIRQLCT